MEKMITAAILGIAIVGAVDAELRENGQPLRGESGSFRNLLLNALGTRAPEAGQVRIPVPADDAVYEVIISKPGEPLLVPIGKVDAD